MNGVIMKNKFYKYLIITTFLTVNLNSTNNIELDNKEENIRNIALLCEENISNIEMLLNKAEKDLKELQQLDNFKLFYDKVNIIETYFPFINDNDKFSNIHLEIKELGSETNAKRLAIKNITNKYKTTFKIALEDGIKTIKADWLAWKIMLNSINYALANNLEITPMLIEIYRFYSITAHDFFNSNNSENFNEKLYNFLNNRLQQTKILFAITYSYVKENLNDSIRNREEFIIWLEENIGKNWFNSLFAIEKISIKNKNLETKNFKLKNQNITIVKIPNNLLENSNLHQILSKNKRDIFINENVYFLGEFDNYNIFLGNIIKYNNEYHKRMNKDMSSSFNKKTKNTKNKSKKGTKKKTLNKTPNRILNNNKQIFIKPSPITIEEIKLNQQIITPEYEEIKNQITDNNLKYFFEVKSTLNYKYKEDIHLTNNNFNELERLINNIDELQIAADCYKISKDQLTGNPNKASFFLTIHFKENDVMNSKTFSSEDIYLSGAQYLNADYTNIKVGVNDFLTSQEIEISRNFTGISKSLFIKECIRQKLIKKFKTQKIPYSSLHSESLIILDLINTKLLNFITTLQNNSKITAIILGIETKFHVCPQCRKLNQIFQHKLQDILIKVINKTNKNIFISKNLKTLVLTSGKMNIEDFENRDFTHDWEIQDQEASLEKNKHKLIILRK
jgi:hypothetical protein